MSFRLTAASGDRLAIHGQYLVPPDTECDVEISLGNGHFHPGLINAHDHLHRNHYPRLGTPPYRDVYEWGTDLHTRFTQELANANTVTRQDALLFGALKNLIAGVTAVVHHDPWEPAFNRDYPIHVARVICAHSLRLTPDFDDVIKQLRSSRRPFSIHLAEGSDPSMAEEVRELESKGLLDERLLAVHVVGPDDSGVRSLHDAGAAVVWCPSSNIFLYGRTAPRTLLQSGVDVLLGTDALVSGQGTILRELRVARQMGFMTEKRLQAAVGATAASRLGLDDPALIPGNAANLVFFRRRLEEATSADVSLVLVDVLPKVADAEHSALFEHCGVQAELLDMGRTPKLVASPLGRVARNIVRTSPECKRIFEEES